MRNIKFVIKKSKLKNIAGGLNIDGMIVMDGDEPAKLEKYYELWGKTMCYEKIAYDKHKQETIDISELISTEEAYSRLKLRPDAYLTKKI